MADISNVDEAAKAMRDEEMLAEIEDFIERLRSGHLARYAEWGPGRYLVIPAWVVRGQPA
ncbi:MAG: hypothetical protein WA709_33375 [Stellaceae bacterium]